MLVLPHAQEKPSPWEGTQVTQYPCSCLQNDQSEEFQIIKKLYLEKGRQKIGISFITLGIKLHKMWLYKFYFLFFPAFLKVELSEESPNPLRPSCVLLGLLRQGRPKPMMDNSIAYCGLCGFRGHKDCDIKCLFKKNESIGHGCRPETHPLQNYPTGKLVPLVLKVVRKGLWFPEP